MFEFLMALGCGIAGLTAGFFLRGALSRQLDSKRGDSAPAAALAEESTDDTAIDREMLNQVAAQLRHLTARVAADVDEHHSRVQQANNALSDADMDSSSEAIVSTVAELIKANQHMQLKLQQAQERIHTQAEQIQTAEVKASTDALTKLFNRRALDEKLEQCHQDPALQPCSLMLLDVDHFKKFNDTYGHLAGDDVLCRVANMIGAQLSEIAFVARFGGEEFAVVFAGHDIASCRQQAEKTRRAIGEREIIFAGQSLGVHASAGMAQLQPGESVAQWIERADKALYKSKHSGRNCGHWMDAGTPRPLGDPTDPLTSPTQSDADAEQRNLSKLQLPSEKKLREHFARVTGRLAKVNVELFVMVIRCDQAERASITEDRMLRVIRATTRSLDYIGETAKNEILICMPSANESSALDRAQRIQANVERSLASAAAGPLTVSIGIASATGNKSFDSVSAMARAAVDEVQRTGGNRYAVGHPQQIASV